jgi:hypothetical protein
MFDGFEPQKCDGDGGWLNVRRPFCQHFAGFHEDNRSRPVIVLMTGRLDFAACGP